MFIMSVAIFLVLGALDYVRQYGFSFSRLFQLKMRASWIVPNVATAILAALLIAGIEEFVVWKRERSKGS